MDLEHWAEALKEALGIEAAVEVDLLLDVARAAAHGVARPAAPLTTFLIGVAAGREDGSPQAVRAAAEVAARLAAEWAPPEQ